LGFARKAHSLPEDAAVHRKPLKDEVFDVLHARIVEGRYVAGQWLRQVEISSQLGVSMTPVREALDLLVASGLAERVPYRGVRVLQPSEVDILNSYGMRLLLEAAGAYSAALNISSGQLEVLLGLLEESRSLVNLDDMSTERALSRELHSTIVSASGNPLLHKAYLTVLNAFPDWMLYEHLFRHPELLEASIVGEHREHRLIIEALVAHIPPLAVRRTLEHVMNRGQELVSYLGIPLESLRAKERQILPLVQFQADGLSVSTLEKEMQ
jgi:DNA-binding GntR family transcriptional regulator